MGMARSQLYLISEHGQNACRGFQEVHLAGMSEVCHEKDVDGHRDSFQGTAHVTKRWRQK
jgi:hypothetical protein